MCNLCTTLFFSEVDLWDWDNLLEENLQLCKLLIVPNKEVSYLLLLLMQITSAESKGGIFLLIMARIGRMNIKFEIIQLTFNKNSYRDVFAYQQEFIIRFNCMELCPFKLFNFEIFYHINPQKTILQI